MSTTWLASPSCASCWAVSSMAEKQNTPEIRFEGFTDPWEQRKFSDIVDVCSGKDYKHLEEGPIPVYGTGGFMTSVDEALSYDRNAVGIGRKGTIDKPYLLKAPFWTVDTLFYAIPKSDVDLEFAHCSFLNVDWKSKDESTGLPSLSKEAINETIALVPISNEQSRLGEFFSNLDFLITLHQRKHDKLCTMKRSMLDKMFPKPGETEPEIRFKGFTDPWEQRKLGELGFAQSGIGFPDAEQGGTEGTPFFKVSDMNTPGNEYELVASNNYVTAEQIARMGWRPINQVPAIFFAKVGAAVMLNRKRLVNEPFLLDNNTMAFSMDSSLLDTQFGRSLFERLDLTSLIQVGALPSFNSSDVESISVSLPSTMNEQRQIGQYLYDLNTLITLHQRKLDLLKNTKKSLLDKMFV